MATKLFKNIKFYNKIDSTNLEAKRFIKNGKIDCNTVFVAKTQTSGKGRLNRKWISENGGLWFSLVFPNKNFQSDITIFTSVVLHKVLKKIFPDSILKIKWPNDIFFHDKKIAGILGENSNKSSIIGIGINLNQKKMKKDISEIATSFFIEIHKKINIKSVLRDFLQNFEDEFPKYIEEEISSFIKYFQMYDYLLGRQISVSIGNENWQGKAAGISKKGKLKVEINRAEKRFISVDKIDLIW